MTWNYRIVRRTSEGDTFYGIYETYYENGEIDFVTERECAPFGESPEELKEDIEMMAAAFGRPVLDYETREEIK